MHLRRLGTALLRLNPRPRSFRKDPLSEKRAAAAVSNTFLGQVARESTVSLTVPVPESSVSTPDLRRGAPAGCARLPGARDGCAKHGSAARPCPTREGRRVLPGARPATMILPRGSPERLSCTLVTDLHQGFFPREISKVHVLVVSKIHTSRSGFAVQAEGRIGTTAGCCRCFETAGCCRCFEEAEVQCFHVPLRPRAQGIYASREECSWRSFQIPPCEFSTCMKSGVRHTFCANIPQHRLLSVGG